MAIGQGLFGCFSPPSKRPQEHKGNAIYLNAIIMNSGEIFTRLGSNHEEFRKKMRKLFTDASGESIHFAVQELHKSLLHIPDIAPMATAIMETAVNSVSLDGVADEEEMESLRDSWLRRVNNFTFESDSNEVAVKEVAEIAGGKEASSMSTTSGFITLPIFFATNRNAVGGKVKQFYGTERSPQVSWGVMWLSLPDRYGYGDMKDHVTWRHSAKRTGAPRNKIVHLTTIPLGDSCVMKISEVMRSAGEKECILFVHGYNTTMANACKRLAQVAYTGNFQGPAFVFSWPSKESMASYTTDEANVMWAVPDFMDTLRYLMKDLGMSKVHILAHSMGSRLAIYSLLRLPTAELKAPGMATIGRVVFAAPDFDMGEFLYLAEDLSERCERLTLYCSEDDQALGLSRSLHGGYPRLGDFRGFVALSTDPKLLSLKKFDAINTTGTDNSWVRHAYVFDACGIIMDCCVVLRMGLLPHNRESLVFKRLPSGAEYWTFETTPTGAVKASGKSTVMCRLGYSLSSMASKNSKGSASAKASEADSGEDVKVEVVIRKVEDAVEDSVKEIDDEEFKDEVPAMVGSGRKGAPQLTRQASTAFMAEFAHDLASPSVGGTLHVEPESAEEVGGNDVKLSSEAEKALSMDSHFFQKTFNRSKSVVYHPAKARVLRATTMASNRL